MKHTNPMPAAGAGANNNNDPRETMLSLPAWLQPALTALTGKAPWVGEPWWRWTPAGRMWATLAWFFAALTVGVWAAHTGGAALLLLPMAWLLTVSNARIIQTGLVHQASHGMLLADKVRNELAGELLSLLIWIQPLAHYREKHGPHHWKTAQESDEDLAFLVKVGGLRPGISVSESWRHFWLTLVSPRFHAEFLRARLKANFVDALPIRRAASVAFAAGLMALTLSGFGRELLLGYLLPVTLLTQMSAWAGMLGLHQWVPKSGASTKAESLASLTSGRFVGEAAPSPDLTGIDAVYAWTGWSLRMSLVHLPLRLAVVPGDLPLHDWHHFHPNTREWANAAYARRDDLLNKTGKARSYEEIWGAGAAIAATFERLTAFPQNAKLGHTLTYDGRSRGFLGM